MNDEDHVLLSEKLEDQLKAVEWAHEQKKILDDTISSIFSLNCLSISVSPTIISSKNKLPVVFLRIKSTVLGFFNSFPFIKDFGRAFFDSEKPNVQFPSAVASEHTTRFFRKSSST